MRILVDENIPRPTVRFLVSAGHDVRDIRGTGEEGMRDEILWQLAVREKRLLITTDRWFGSRRHEAHFGVLVVRLKRPTRSTIHARILDALAHVAESEWPGLLIVARDTVLTSWREHLRDR